MSMTKVNNTILCVKGTMRSISDSVKSLLEHEIERLGWESFYKITDKEILNLKTGTRFIFYGLQNPERLKSLESVDICWIEEATVDITEKALDILFPTIRKAGSKIFITFNPMLETDAVYKRFVLNNEPDSIVIKMNYYDNPHLSNEIKSYIKHIKETDTAKYLHYFEGELAQKVEGLFKPEWIQYQDIDHKTLDKIVIAIDPSITSKDTSDECGIIVAGVLGNHYYVLEDASGVMSPKAWSSKAITLYHKYEANQIIYENNQGGDIVKTVIRQMDSDIAIRDVRATRGKLLRAEPVAALYEQGLVSHVKRFPDLEYQMTMFDGTGSSPDRLDALVYALTSFLKTKIKPITSGLKY